VTNAADLAPAGYARAGVDGRPRRAVYGQPLIVGDRVFAATENDTVYALNSATGAVVWSAHVGTARPCSSSETVTIALERARLPYALALSPRMKDVRAGRRCAQPGRGDRGSALAFGWGAYHVDSPRRAADRPYGRRK